MPIDTMILDPMLNTFRNMLKDILSKNLSGPDVDSLVKTMERMESLGQEHSDINTFNGAMMQENLFAEFSGFYSKILANEAQQQQESGDGSYDDAGLLKQSVDALKNAISEIKRRYEESIETAKADKTSDDNSIETSILNNPELIIKGIQDVINLGEQDGMTLPRFLKLQIEKGLDKAMEGSVVARNGQEYLLNFTKASPISPFHIKKETEKLNKFDELASKQKFNLPNLKELSYAHRDINTEYDKPIAIWDNITKRWDDLLWQLSFWSLSYCSFAPNIEPWSMSPLSERVAATIQTQKTVPGIFKQKERLFEKYQGIKFNDIFKHETFQWAVKYNFIDYSQEYIEFLIEKIYPECKPFNDLNSDLIKEKESFYKEKRQANPERNMPAKNIEVFYNNKFGEGRYKSKFGEIPNIDSNAKPWNLNNLSSI